ncbi:UAA transporter [Laetiporus sulphureus 93-53]|uniref:UAA transporter n=1 Tax=Laetiporus sulphureus 93-53 TaxID=1314785 RepID=A0A165I6S1_9APHY|nr:UAA transporter [Laetiporus sulphureus 93-53]KZT12668.1 UAA transporter [Laetiporus sulphureus 93-53]
MSSTSLDVVRGLSFTLLSDWTTILSLIFGGCCSNALTLEQITTEYPYSGSLITFCQFLVVSLYGLPKFVVWKPYPHLKPRQIPIWPYLVQVLLFYLISLLNNAAFGYSIPMTVHIIFRSGGLVVSMLLNWMLLRRRYTILQVFSVLVVTLGVVLTTMSASGPKKQSTSGAIDPLAYAKGISLMTAALVLGGFLGIVQDRTYAWYGHRESPGSKSESLAQKSSGPPWQEAMFYLHFLSMPMFYLIRKDIASQFRAISTGPKLELSLPAFLLNTNLTPPLISTFDFGDASVSSGTLTIPTAYIPLFLNTITQLFCVSGVHQLSARVSSLTVTLMLVVRKAVSLIISVVLFSGTGRVPTGMKLIELWAGALLVFGGTVGYSLGGKQRPKAKEKAKQE